MTLPSVNPSARVQRIASPMATPGQCGICGKHKHDQGFIDMRLIFDNYGTLIFCADCTGEMARALGFLSSDDLVGMREHIEAQDIELNTLRQAVLGLESAVDGLTNYRDARDFMRPDKPGRSVTDLDELPDVPINDTESGTTDENSEKSERVHPPVANGGKGKNADPAEPATEQGPDDAIDLAVSDADLAELGIDL